MSRAITTLEDATGWHQNVPVEDVERAWKAAEAYVSVRVTWPGRDADPATDPPADLVAAVQLMTARLLQRRKSPEGVIGMDADGLGAVRVPRVDVDVQALMAPWRPVVFG